MENTAMKITKIAGIAGIIILALAIIGVGFAFAQQPTPSPWGNYGPGGMMGRGGMIGGYGQDGYGWMNGMHQWMTQTGGMHTPVWEGLAKALGMTVEELDAELSSGKTLLQIAEEQNVSQEELAAALEKSVQEGLDQAVADGVLTQEQADALLAHMAGNYGWMITHMGAYMGAPMGRGPGFGAGGCHGNGFPQGNS
jgi:hypothetical protein